MLASVVELDQLLEIVWVSLVAGIGVTAVFSLVILSVARSDAARRAGRDGRALGFGVVAVLAFLAFAAMVVVGVVIMLHK